MKTAFWKRALALVLAMALLAGYVPAVEAAETTKLRWKKSDVEVTAQLDTPKMEQTDTAAYGEKEMVRVAIVLEKESTLEAGFPTRNIGANTQAMAYHARLRKEQDALAQTIATQVLKQEKLDVHWNLTLVHNIISATVPYGKIQEIAQVKGVADVVLEQSYVPQETVSGEVAPNTAGAANMVGSPSLWGSGYTGAGTRIAIIDTGTDMDHQSFSADGLVYALEQNAARKGMSVQSYLNSLDLMNVSDISLVLTQLNAYERGGYSAEAMYFNEKVPFGFNYVDHNTTITHDYDYQGSHGSHVAGIAAANRYVPQDGGYVDARDNVFVCGVAPDAQILTMKVFGNAAGPYDSDYMAAIEDAILLGADAVNLSLGTGNPGLAHSELFQDMMDFLQTTDTVVVMSAGNSGRWMDATTYSYLYSDDVSFDTVGAPGSQTNAFTVASVNNTGVVANYFLVNGQKVFYNDQPSYGNQPMTSLNWQGSGTEYDFVFIDGLGYTEDYAGMDLNGKVVFCSRGVTNFAEKANNAAALGAAAVVVYNNESTGLFGMDLTGYRYYAPCVAISQEDAAFIRANAQARSGNGNTWYEGTLTVTSQVGVTNLGTQYHTISSFSSWGVPGDLSLKPEITAPGGEIYSVNGMDPSGKGYEYMSGTSMAAPHVTGMAALVIQYLKESGKAEGQSLTIRAMAQSLLMSTAQPMYEADSGGQYYSLMAQGAGLARVDLAAMAETYLTVNGTEDGKVKAELGDDPQRTGDYRFSFTIHNISNKEMRYTLSADVFTQDVFEGITGDQMMDTWTVPLAAQTSFRVNGRELTAIEGYHCDLNGDGVTNADDADHLLAHVLDAGVTLNGNGDLDGDGQVTAYDAHVLLQNLNSGVSGVVVPVGGSVQVDVSLKLTAETKAKLNRDYPDGAYVEAFVYVEPVSDEEGAVGVTHSIPVLGFYGNWSDSGMFDRGNYYSVTSGQEQVPYLFYQHGGKTNVMTVDYGDGNEYIFGGNPVVEEPDYNPARSAFNNESGYRLEGFYFTLIRNAAAVRLEISNAETGEVFGQLELGTRYSAYYHVNMGQWQNVQDSLSLRQTLAGLPEGTKVRFELTAAPEYYCDYLPEGGFDLDWDALGDGASLTYETVIDNTAPQALEIELDPSDPDTLHVTAKDNGYVAAVALLNLTGDQVILATPGRQNTPNQAQHYDLDLRGVYGNRFLVAVYDYAMNETVYEVTLDREMNRPYFTLLDLEHATYLGVDTNSRTVVLADVSRRNPGAAAYVEGYVFEVSRDGQVYVAPDAELANAICLGALDPEDLWEITSVLDLAYNRADGKLYGLFYSQRNDQAVPYLFTLDMYSGEMEVLGAMPVDAFNLAIDKAGNFYSLGYNSSTLYTYTADAPATGSVSIAGQSGNYSTDSLNSLAWDYNTDRLYWTCSDMLMEIDVNTGVMYGVASYGTYGAGLYIAHEPTENLFAPVNHITSVVLDSSEATVPVGTSKKLTVQVTPWNCADSSMNWFSSDESVASVDENGVVTGLSEGTTVISAVSRLDPGKEASCVVTVTGFGDTLNAIIWDEYGEIWWTEFSPDSLPDYVKLNAESETVPLTGTALMPDGTLYACTTDLSSGTSDLYRVDPDTLALERIGGSDIVAYVDIAPAPSVLGGTLVATFFEHLLLVDPSSGDYMGVLISGFSHNLVGIAYVGSEPFDNYGFNSIVDWYYLVDNSGAIYLLGIMEQDGQIYYLQGTEAANGLTFETGIETDDSYFCSLYFNGEFLYYSCFDSVAGLSTLYAIDVLTDGSSYKLGDFGDNVWPASGLVELDKPPVYDVAVAHAAMEPKLASVETEVAGVEMVSHPKGNTNRVALPLERNEDQQWVSEQPFQVRSQRDGVSGVMELTYDPAVLEVLTLTGATDAFAWVEENGMIRIAYASLEQVSLVADLVLRSQPGGDHAFAVHQSQVDAQWADSWLETWIHGHAFAEEVTEPDCENGGCTVYTCSCGLTWQGAYTDPLGHDWDDGVVTKEPTEETEGERLYTCNRCGETYTESIPVKDHEHKYESAVTDPTCTERGYTTHTCRCGDSYVDSWVDALGHDWDNGVVTREPTEETEGERLYTCNRCDATYTESIPVKDHEHKYDAVVTAPTCTERGYTTHTCRCGDSYVDSYVDALGHDWDDGVVTREPTEENEGERLYTCNRCDATYTESIPVKDHEHKYDAVVTDPTCTEGGYTTHTCRCGDSYVDSYTAALGHDMGAWTMVKAPSCTEKGTERRDCSRCDHHETREVGATGHNYGSWTVVKEATSTESGLKIRTCKTCGHTEEQTIPRKSNPFSDVKETDFFYESVLWAVDNNITAGMGPGTFKPNVTCTRGQVVTFLWRAAGCPEPESGVNPFRDVKESDFYYKAVLWAVENGITAGMGEGTFKPNVTCNRAQVVTFLWRTMGCPKAEDRNHPFRDVKEDMYYYEAMLWAVENGITAGYGATTFAPDMGCTRGQVVTFLYRTLAK